MNIPTISKPKIVKDYDQLSESFREKIKLHYPFGFEQKLISFKNAQGKFVSALPYESDDSNYLIRMTPKLANDLIDEDDDYDDDGNLKDDVLEEYQERYE